MPLIKNINTVLRGRPAIAKDIRLQPEDGIVVFIHWSIQPVIELLEEAGIAIIKGQTGCRADGQAATGQFFQAIHIIVWYGIGLRMMKVLCHFCTVPSVETIRSGYPKESVVVLCKVVDVIAAEPFGHGQLFYEMRDPLRVSGRRSG